MNQTTRQEKIVDLISETGEGSIQDFARQFKVSEMTIRRDLDQLALQGRVIRTHGGATLAGQVSFEFGFLKRKKQNQTEKEAIARRVAELVRDGQSVMLDSGTTTLAIARALRSKKGLTIITSSLPIASELQYHQDTRVLLLGGYLRSGAPDLEGALTESNLEQLRADIAFLGADGIDRKGHAYNASLSVGRMLTKMTASANEVYVVADQDKLGRTALSRYGNIAKWSGLITSRSADKPLLAALRRNGVRILTA
ncbi:MAG: DeoR/GlpR family DNA-binding transcription regulator [Verrucomicrobiota bacterium]